MRRNHNNVLIMYTYPSFVDLVRSPFRWSSAAQCQCRYRPLLRGPAEGEP